LIGPFDFSRSIEDVAARYLPHAKPYSRWQAHALYALQVTKSLRSEYDHLMLQLHDAMKADRDYQRTAPQVTMPFPADSVWVCFSDQTPHAVMSGQYMMEQTFHLPIARQYNPDGQPTRHLDAPHWPHADLRRLARQNYRALILNQIPWDVPVRSL
jgi:hypothetical protein